MFLLHFRIDELIKEKSASLSEHLQTIKQLSVENETLVHSFKVQYSSRILSSQN